MFASEPEGHAISFDSPRPTFEFAAECHCFEHATSSPLPLESSFTEAAFCRSRHGEARLRLKELAALLCGLVVEPKPNSDLKAPMIRRRCQADMGAMACGNRLHDCQPETTPVAVACQRRGFAPTVETIKNPLPKKVRLKPIW